MVATVRDIVMRALRLSKAISDGEVPEGSEGDDGLLAWNAMLGGLFGNGIGGKLVPVRATATFSVEPCDLVLVGSVTATLGLPATPNDGDRFGVADAQNGVAAHPVTINANGNLIDGATTLALTANGAGGSWFYRADIGTWTSEADQELDDPVMFPRDVHEGLTAMLAVRLASEYGQEIPATVVALAQQGGDAIGRRYSRRARVQNDPTSRGTPRAIPGAQSQAA